MAAIKITNFLGMIPRTAERLLPDLAAQQAENVNLTSGEIRPVRGNLTVLAEPTVQTAVYRAVYGSGEKWNAWTLDVDVAKAPFSVDVEPRYVWTGDGCPRYASYTEFGTTSYALGLPAPTTKSTVSSAGGTGSTESRSYCYTFYQPTTGEESAPSTTSDIVAGKVDGTWTISGFSGTPSNTRAAQWNTSGLKQRLYRTAGTAATFELVAERDVATTDWTDTVLTKDMLGDSLISQTWLPPPEGLTGVVTLANGSMAGFIKNVVCYSEPYQPHAWPVEYQMQVDFPIVGLASYGTAIVAATSAYPYVLDGLDPSVVTSQKINNAWPCLSKRSVTAYGNGVIYATTYGLAYVGSDGYNIFTKDLYTREEWEPLNPASMVCACAEGRIFVAYTKTDSPTRMLMIYTDEVAALTEFDYSPNELYVDPNDGRLYLVGKNVDKFDAGVGVRVSYNWRSKEIELPEPLNFAACKVEFASTLSAEDNAAIEAETAATIAANAAKLANPEAYNRSELNYSEYDAPTMTPLRSGDFLYLSLYMRNGEVATVEVLDNRAFHLPSGYKSDIMSIRLRGNVRVKSVKLAESMIGLKQV